MGGNLCNASPAADTAVALLTLDTEVGLVSSQGRRLVALRDFLFIQEAKERATETTVQKMEGGER